MASSSSSCAHPYHLGGSSSLLQSSCSSASSPLLLQSRQCSPARFAAAGLGCKLATTASQKLVPHRRRLKTQALRQDGDRDDGFTSGDETPESLFTKELKRRGLAPSTKSTETKTKQETIGGGNTGKAAQSVKSSVPSSPPWEDEKQLERSRALNSEGLEGLVPRATELIKLGFTIFLPMWPLMLLIIAGVIALYLTQPTFIHGAENVKPYQYVDPYKLLEENALSNPAYTPLDL